MREEGGLSRIEWQDRQTEKLRTLLAHASNTVEYYGRLFDRAGFRAEGGDLCSDLVRVPPLTKELIRENAEALVSTRADRSRLHANSTGGSTGVPLSFFQDGFYETISMALSAHVPEWWGIRPYDRIASVWGADEDVSQMSLRERFYQWRSRTRILNAFRMNEKELEDFARMLEHWRPPYMRGYATALEALARHVLASGRRPPSFTAISSSAETLWPEQRELIEQTFQSPVYNYYGSREVSNLAAECPEEKRLHQISTWRYIEILDNDGQPVADGEPGSVAVTDSSNFSMPFIRYVNGDVAKLDRKPCECGRPSPVLDALLGRTTDLIRTPEGELVHGEFFTHLFYGARDIKQFQVHQVSLNRLVVRYVPESQAEAPDLSEVVSKIRERMGSAVQIDLSACGDIPSLPNGKRRFTISDVSSFAKPSQQSAF